MLYENFGVSISCTSGGGPNLTSDHVENMIRDYGIKHRVSSVGDPNTNSRSELLFKTVKKMLRDNISTTSKLDRAKLSRVPTMEMFRRELWDFLTRPGAVLVDEVGRCQGEGLVEQRHEQTRMLGMV